MTKFTYTGENRDGTEVTKSVTAEDRYAVYEIARKAGHSVTSISKHQRFSLSSLLNVKRIEYFISRVSDDELVMMTRNLGSMISAGLPLTRALSVIERQSKNPRLKRTITEIHERINKGEQLHEALSSYPKTFNNLYVAMVKAGEESGELAEALSVLGMQMEKAVTLKKKVKGAMIYPAIVLTILVIIGILMMVYVMPSITSTFASLDVDLPASTEFLIGTSNFINNNLVLVIIGMIAVVVGFIQFLRTTIGKRIFSWCIIRVPVVGTLAKEVNSARTARTLSSLLNSGVDVIRAINITEEVVQNVYYKRVLVEAAREVEKGSALSETFTAYENLYPVLVGEMVAVGEETGQISKMLEQLAQFYENEVDQKTKDLSTIIEPILMVVIGGTVGFFALAVITPIYSISDSIG